MRVGASGCPDFAAAFAELVACEWEERFRPDYCARLSEARERQPSRTSRGVVISRFSRGRNAARSKWLPQVNPWVLEGCNVAHVVQWTGRGTPCPFRKHELNVQCAVKPSRCGQVVEVLDQVSRRQDDGMPLPT